MNKFKNSFLVIAAALFILGSCNEKEEKIFSIELSQKEAYDFPLATSNDYTVMPLSVTITNTGNQPTGPLTVSLSGANANAFVLSTTTLLLDAGKSSAFTVEPETGLAMGIYNATVTVSGGNGIVAQSFNVRFEINVFGIDLSQKGVYEFSAATTADYTVTPLSVTVTNIGNQPTGALTVALSGAGADGFSLLETAIASIAVGGTATFSVAPKTGLSLPEYNATVTVSGGANLTAKSFDVQFAINIFAIELSRTDAYEFPSETVGDYTVTPLSVTITNSGYLSTGQLTVALSGDNADDFSLSETTIASIAVGSTATFTVAPKTGLLVGEYAATVTVSGNSSITAKSFDVQFEVKSALIIQDIPPMQQPLTLGTTASTYVTIWSNTTDEALLTFYLKLGTSINDLMDEDGKLAQNYVDRRYATGVRLENAATTAGRRIFCFAKWGLNSPSTCDFTQWVFAEFRGTADITNSTVPFDQKNFMQKLMNQEAGMVIVVKSKTEYDFYVDRGDGKYVWCYTFNNSAWTNNLQRVDLLIGANSSAAGNSRNNFGFDVTSTLYIKGQVCIGVADPTVFVEVVE